MAHCASADDLHCIFKQNGYFKVNTHAVVKLKINKKKKKKKKGIKKKYIALMEKRKERQMCHG
jgi:hypothetical protein